jgi:imidazolonepropionase
MIYLKNAAQILTVSGASHTPKRGKQMEQLGVIPNGGIVIEGDIIAFVGPDEEAQRYVEQRRQQPTQIIDAGGKLATPGLIDPHTHAIYAGSREFEFSMRLKGAAYMDILRAGGGILHTTQQTRRATEEQLFEQSLKRLERFLAHGVTTIEAKSGYGLNIDAELKQLTVASSLNGTHPIEVVPTFMGAHAIPPEYGGDTDAYVHHIVQDMLPAVSGQGIAEFCDVFCEEHVFTVEQSRRILEAGKLYGLKPKLHADEIAMNGGGAELAAELGAVSADHLLNASGAGIRRMAERGVIAVLLPGTAFFLMKRPADARRIVDAGVPVALATDCNPGSSPTESLPFIMSLACLTMGMTPAEAIAACTINAAHAVGRASRIGSLEVGKQGDVVLFDAPNPEYLISHYAVNLVDTVIKKGRQVIQGGVRQRI